MVLPPYLFSPKVDQLALLNFKFKLPVVGPK